MKPPSPKIFNRALHLICNEWGKTLDEAMRWLEDDSQWQEEDKGPPNNVPAPPSECMPFIQCTRTTVIPRDSEYSAELERILGQNLGAKK